MTICLRTTRTILKTLKAIIKIDPILFHLRYVSLSFSRCAFGFRIISRYMIPGMVNEVSERPKAPTNSNTTAMLSMKMAPRTVPMYRKSVSE